MKKLSFFFIFIISFIFLSINCKAYESINIDIIDVQTTNVSFVFDAGDITESDLKLFKDTASNIKKDKLELSFDVSNVNFAYEFKNNYETLIEELSLVNNTLAKEMESKNISIQSSFYGYPFGGRNTLIINGENLNNPWNIKSKGTFSINNSSYVKSDSITPGNEEFMIEYGINTIDKLIITIEPQSNYKTILVRYDIFSSGNRMNEMSEDAYNKYDYKVIYQNSNNLSLEYSYADLGGFNHLFAMDLVRIFNIVAKVEIETSQSLFNTMNIDVDFVESENIKDVTLNFKLPEKAKDNFDNKTDSFEYKLSKPIDINIGYKTINTMSLVVIIIVPISIIFVIGCFYILNKRGSHIRTK